MPQARPPTQPMQQNGQQNAPQQQQQGQRPGAPQRALTPAQYQQALAEMTARQRAQLQQSAGGSQAQTDGAGDDADELFFGVVKRVDALGHEVEMGRIEIDNMIRERILAKGKAMEGGGLMMPLQKAPKRRRVESSTTTSVNGPHPAVASSSSSTVPSAQFDGAADDDDDDNKDGIIKDEDLDEDAINSDLDDPEDALNDDDDDDENLGNIMLCMYDKVQRVKNKW
jgi:transcription initiation factor TFIIA large subunit